MAERKNINVLYGMTYWSMEFVFQKRMQIDLICDKKAMFFAEMPQLEFAGIPVVNVEYLAKNYSKQKVNIYICVGTNKRVVDSIVSDIKNAGLTDDIVDLFDENQVEAVRNIFKRRVEENSSWLENGNKKDDSYVVITNNEEYAKYQGILSNIQAVLGYVNEVRLAGANPLVDLRLGMGTVDSFWSFQGDKSNNGWDNFFRQPNPGDEIENIYAKSRVKYINKQYAPVSMLDWYRVLPTDDKTYAYWSRIVKENIHIREKLEKRIDTFEKKYFINQKVLGVAIRSEFRYGGEQGLELYKGHPIVGKVEEYIDAIERKISDWGCEKIFLLIDDREYHEKIKEHFGRKFISTGRPLPHFFKDGEPIKKGLPIDEKRNKVIFEELEDISQVEKTESYLIETYLLSRCSCLYCTPGSAQAFAYLLNDGQYDGVEVDNRGFY